MLIDFDEAMEAITKRYTVGGMKIAEIEAALSSLKPHYEDKHYIYDNNVDEHLRELATSISKVSVFTEKVRDNLIDLQEALVDVKFNG